MIKIRFSDSVEAFIEELKSGPTPIDAILRSSRHFSPHYPGALDRNNYVYVIAGAIRKSADHTELIELRLRCGTYNCSERATGESIQKSEAIMAYIASEAQKLGLGLRGGRFEIIA